MRSALRVVCLRSQSLQSCAHATTCSRVFQSASSFRWRQRAPGERPVKRLNPVFQVDGTPKVMLSQRLGAVASSLVEGSVANLEARRTEIIGALDIVFTGI